MIKSKINLPEKRPKAEENWEPFVNNSVYLAPSVNPNPKLKLFLPLSPSRSGLTTGSPNLKPLTNPISLLHASNAANKAILASFAGLNKKSKI